MGNEYGVYSRVKKKQTESGRELTTPLFYLRCLQIGLSFADLELISIGMVIDMFIEKNNDEYEYDTEIEAQQSDFDSF